MSSDEEEPGSPALPQDSDRGSSVSSELQDEYEQLLRHAVVTPKFEPNGSQLLQPSPLSGLSQNHPLTQGQTSRATEEDSGRHSGTGRGVASARASPHHHQHSPRLEATEDLEMMRRSPGSERLRRSPSPRSAVVTPRSDIADAVFTVETEVSVSEENMSRMENLLDMWSSDLKTNVLMELRKWKLAFAEQHKLVLRKEREAHAANMAAQNAEMDSLRDLLHTYEISSQRKDEVIKNLSLALDRQRERLEMMRSFSQWKMRCGAAREEAQAERLAQQHYMLQLKRKVWVGWHSLISGRWKERVEKACRARAEEVCSQLANDYEAKLTESMEALQRAQTEIQKLHVEKENYEESMKKSFMRGVCALNMEALGMFHHGGQGVGQGGRLAPHNADAPPPRDDLGFASLAAGLQQQQHQQQRPFSSFSDGAFGMESQGGPSQGQGPGPSSRTDMDRMSPGPSLFLSQMGAGSSMALPRAEPAYHPPATATITAAGASSSAHRQAGARAATAGPQRPGRTVTARVTGRADGGARATVPSSVRVTPSGQALSTNVVVERHHPASQVTVGQAGGRYPRSVHQGQALPSRSSSNHSSTHIHAVKVVE
ncbi:centrosomal protein POC5 [Engraulis encrasicolus]|uniref:centrosomal protein POC5 n=1 Tax=Engraulis encrasicolus TaxID=184585 RepID=UPI002FD6E12A